MTRGFAWITAALTAMVGLLVGMVVAGSTRRRRQRCPRRRSLRGRLPSTRGHRAAAGSGRPPGLPSISPTWPSSSILPSSTSTPARAAAAPARRPPIRAVAPIRWTNPPTSAGLAERGAAPRHRDAASSSTTGADPHQPPRDRGRRAHHGEAGRRPQPARRASSAPTPTPTSRSSRWTRREAARRAARRFRPTLRVGEWVVRHRQPAGLRAHRHGRAS